MPAKTERLPETGHGPAWRGANFGGGILQAAVGDITELIQRAGAGEHAAWEALFHQLYEPLRSLARARLSRRGHQTLLDTTGLVHELFLRLRQADRVVVNDRKHFMAYAARSMRSVVVDFARSRAAQRRGGDAVHVTLTDGIAVAASGEDEILQVHAALQTLERVDPRLVRVVEMRYFAGMTEPEIAHALDLTERTVRRDWKKARLLLALALQP
jgi:RNA polymerase sigma factor (TIGR02999 family)